MNIYWIGPVAAASTFIGIWLGHVAVRKIEFYAPRIWVPSLLFALFGIALEGFSLVNGDDIASAALGILGVTLLWDSFEFWRQQNRVRKGHAPANPKNPRHARILAESQLATTIDLLDREPAGRPISPEEAVRLVVESNKKS